MLSGDIDLVGADTMLRSKIYAAKALGSAPPGIEAGGEPLEGVGAGRAAENGRPDGLIKSVLKLSGQVWSELLNVVEMRGSFKSEDELSGSIQPVPPWSQRRPE
jgi:hypothetical protein